MRCYHIDKYHLYLLSALFWERPELLIIASDIIYVSCYRVHDLCVLSLAIAQAYALVKTSLQTVPIRQNGIVVSCSQGAQLSISAYQYPFMHKVYVHFILTIHFRCRYWLPTRIYGMQRSETMLCIDSWTLWWESYLWGQLRWVGLWSVSKHFTYHHLMCCCYVSTVLLIASLLLLFYNTTYAEVIHSHK